MTFLQKTHVGLLQGWTPHKPPHGLHHVPVNLSTKELCSAATGLEEFPGL